MKERLWRGFRYICDAPRALVKAFNGHFADALLAGLIGLTAVLFACLFWTAAIFRIKRRE